MVHLLQHNQINKAAWDACVEASSQRQVYALSWYLDVVSPGWHAVVEQEGGVYTCIMPLPVRRKYGILYLQQPLFCQQLGIYARQELRPAQAEAFLALVQQHFKYTSGYAFCTGNSASLQSVKQEELQRVYTLYLDLNKPYEQLWKGYNRDRKYNLNKARREKLRITHSHDIEPLIGLFRQNIAHKVYGGVDEAAYDTLRQLYTSCVEKGIAELLYTLSEDGSTTAGALFLYYGGYITYIFNAADSSGRKSNGRTLLLDDLIQRNANTPQILDFESPMIESIAGFYQSFGPVPVPFYTLKYNHLPLPLRLLKQARQQLLLRF
ncbi:acetyltransferase (GNAT) family protein [Pontibacter mucosus]|uniref:Acetyltransferase (GNAT) family protein n=1 Tax=Pontibacter mucosus TaxID=1649266 RepID=A0A2T5YSD9_9BACT|nr:GNAT family N-acetyltransferase [Pontibacter mucosus]PTX22242.1 acetyltransferase (GNAT) family protein [Pontibacter mucosus]